MYGLFMWSRYYPCGGTGDFVDCYGSIEEAIEAARERVKTLTTSMKSLVLHFVL